MSRRELGIRLSVLALATLVLCVPLAAQARVSIPGMQFNDWYDARNRDHDGWLHEFNLINYFFLRTTASNVQPDPSGLRGVSLGPLGSLAGSAPRVGKGETYLIEQRWIPVLSFSPFFTSGWASFRAMFEIDFGWGFGANTAGQNRGGGFNADMINIQTKAVYVALFPTKNPRELSIQLGTQPIYDSIYNPHTASLFDIARTGYKLTFVGTDATAATLYSSLLGKAKLAFVPISFSQPNRSPPDNDPGFAYAFLVQADVAYPVAAGTMIGLSYWRLQDDTKGEAFAFDGLVRTGPGSGALSSFTGTAPFNIDRPSGHVNYVGLNFHHNIHFNTSDWAFSGFVMLNFGSFETDSENTANRKIDVFGVAADLEADWNWGRTRDDLVTLEVLYASGDSDPTDDKFSGPFTMNYYGLPGAVWFNHRMLLLFPFTSTINNYTGAVTDISNQGYGMITALASASHDVIPSTLNVKLGGGFAYSAARPVPFSKTDPADEVRRGKFIGAEINAEVKFHIRYLMTIGLHGAYMFKGDFYDGNDNVNGNPWTAFMTFTWYGF